MLSTLPQFRNLPRVAGSCRFCVLRFEMAEDYALDVLLSLDGFEFQFAEGYRVKISARRVQPSGNRPHGVRYSLTLHDSSGHRIYGLDNAHRIKRSRPEFDHRHVYGERRIV